MFRTAAFRCGPSQAARPLFSPSAALGLGRAAHLSAALGLCLGQLASAPRAHPPEVSGVGAQLGFQLCTPSPIIWVRGTGLQVSSGVAYPSFTVQGLRGEGCQRLGLLRRVLYLAAECLYFLFFFWRNSSYSSPPLVQTSTWLLTQPSLALSQESCSRPCAQPGL